MYRHCNGSMLRYHLSRERILERVCTAIAWRLPRRLVMWCAIRVIAHATQGPYSGQVVPELTAMDALKRWDVPHNSPPKGPQLGASEGRRQPGESARAGAEGVQANDVQCGVDVSEFAR